VVKMPQAVFRIGVVGHRPDKLIAETMAALPSTLATLFSTLQTKVLATFEKAESMYDKQTPATMRLVSGLAAGADLMAAEAAQFLAWQTQFLLPESIHHFKARLSPDEQLAFEQVLAKSSSPTEINVYGDEARAAEPHAALGELLLQNIDLLVAVWDGASGRGKGGTAELISEALELQIPVLWLDADDLSLIRYLDNAVSVAGSDHDNTWLDKTQRYLDMLLLPPTVADERQASERLHDYALEKERRWNLGLAFPLFQFLFAGRKLRKTDLRLEQAETAIDKGWQQELQQDPTGTLGNTGARVYAQYAQADMLANYYAQLYRSASVMNYVFTAISVLMALMGLLVSDWKLWWVLLELGLISLVLINTSVGNKARWHQKWLDYRQLAESLRVMLKLSPLAVNGQLFPSQLAQLHRGQGNRWVEWYLSAVSRSINLPGAVINPSIVGQFKQGLADYATDQALYHQRTAAIAHHTDHRLHILGNLCLYGTVLSCLVFLLCYLVMPALAASLKYWVTFFCAVLPAFGAAAFGLRHHGDYEGVALRSKATANHLNQFKNSIADDALGFSEMVKIAHQLNGHNHLELRDWRVTFERRPLAVPA
jgi:Protein of unknown function (DUF4231)